MNPQDIEDMNLRNALQKLPQYAPPIDTWLDIERTLNQEQREQQKLSAALELLPTYTAPDFVWEQIAPQLPTPTKQEAKVFSIARWAAAAAMIGFISTIGLWWYSTRTTPDSIAYSYSTETVDESTLAMNNTGDDEKAFAMVDEICQQQSFICEQPNVKALKSQLDELNVAYSSLKEAIGSYGTDETLHQQLMAVEQERTEILKQIMEQI